MFSTVTMILSSNGLTVKDNKVAGENQDTNSEKVKLSSIPLYPSPDSYDLYVDPPSKVEESVRETRHQFLKLKSEYQPIFDKVSHIYNTGVSHTNESLIKLRDEDNLLTRVGVITVGGVLGLFAARKGRFLKKVSYTALGIAGFGAICYPQESKVLANEGLSFTQKNLRIAYHFLAGSRPNVQNENGKVLNRMTGMVSDIGSWGLNIFKQEKSEKAVEEPVQPEVINNNSKEAESASEEVPSIPSETPTPDAAEVVKEETTEVVDETISTYSEPIITEVQEPIVQGTPEAETEQTLPSTTEAPATEVETEEVPPSTNGDSKEEELIKKIVEGDLGQGNLEDVNMYTTRE